MLKAKKKKKKKTSPVDHDTDTNTEDKMIWALDVVPIATGTCLFYFIIFLFFIFYFFVFLPSLGPLPRHIEVPRLGVKLEL